MLGLYRSAKNQSARSCPRLRMYTRSIADSYCTCKCGLVRQQTNLQKKVLLGAVYPRNSTSNQPRRTRTKCVDFTFYVIQLLSMIAFQGEISHPNTLRKLPGKARLRSSLKAHAFQVSRYTINHNTMRAWSSLSVVLINGSGHAGGRRDRGPRGYSTRSMMIPS